MYKKFCLTVVAIGLLAAMPAADAQARLRRVLNVQPPAVAQAPALPTPGAVADCCAPVCCPVNICYRDLSCYDPCQPRIKTTISVCDPCTGCPVLVDVCLPACCTDMPVVCDRCTVFARGATTYSWCCGFSATVRFCRNGDVLVTYRG